MTNLYNINSLKLNHKPVYDIDDNEIVLPKPKINSETGEIEINDNKIVYEPKITDLKPTSLLSEKSLPLVIDCDEEITDPTDPNYKNKLLTLEAVRTLGLKDKLMFAPTLTNNADNTDIPDKTLDPGIKDKLITTNTLDNAYVNELDLNNEEWYNENKYKLLTVESVKDIDVNVESLGNKLLFAPTLTDNIENTKIENKTLDPEIKDKVLSANTLENTYVKDKLLFAPTLTDNIENTEIKREYITVSTGITQTITCSNNETSENINIGYYYGTGTTDMNWDENITREINNSNYIYNFSNSYKTVSVNCSVSNKNIINIQQWESYEYDITNKTLNYTGTSAISDQTINVSDYENGKTFTHDFNYTDDVVIIYHVKVDVKYINSIAELTLSAAITTRDDSDEFEYNEFVKVKFYYDENGNINKVEDNLTLHLSNDEVKNISSNTDISIDEEYSSSKTYEDEHYEREYNETDDNVKITYEEVKDIIYDRSGNFKTETLDSNIEYKLLTTNSLNDVYVKDKLLFATTLTDNVNNTEMAGEQYVIKNTYINTKYEIENTNDSIVNLYFHFSAGYMTTSDIILSINNDTEYYSYNANYVKLNYNKNSNIIELNHGWGTVVYYVDNDVLECNGSAKDKTVEASGDVYECMVGGGSFKITINNKNGKMRNIKWEDKLSNESEYITIIEVMFEYSNNNMISINDKLYFYINNTFTQYYVLNNNHKIRDKIEYDASEDYNSKWENSEGKEDIVINSTTYKLAHYNNNYLAYDIVSDVAEIDKNIEHKLLTTEALKNSYVNTLDMKNQEWVNENKYKLITVEALNNFGNITSASILDTMIIYDTYYGKLGDEIDNSNYEFDEIDDNIRNSLCSYELHENNSYYFIYNNIKLGEYEIDTTPNISFSETPENVKIYSISELLYNLKFKLIEYTLTANFSGNYIDIDFKYAICDSQQSTNVKTSIGLIPKYITIDTFKYPIFFVENNNVIAGIEFNSDTLVVSRNQIFYPKCIVAGIKYNQIYNIKYDNSAHIISYVNDSISIENKP